MRLVACVFLVACGGGGGGEIKGDPLIVSSLTAEFNNNPWTPVYGFARMETVSFMFFVGDHKISCEDEFMGDPRDGHHASLGVVGAPMVGNTTVNYDLLEVIDGDSSSKGGQGTLMITSVTATDVSAVFGFTTTIEGGSYSLTGAATIVRCP